MVEILTNQHDFCFLWPFYNCEGLYNEDDEKLKDNFKTILAHETNIQLAS